MKTLFFVLILALVTFNQSNLEATNRCSCACLQEAAEEKKPSNFSSIDSTEIQKLLQKEVDNQYFSGTVLIAEKGKTVYHQSYGNAYEQGEAKIKLDTKFSIASITKMFTAIVVLQFVQEGKLSLEDSLEELLPNLSIPDGNKITVHHLLLHISGLPNEKNKIYHQAVSPVDFVNQTLKNKQKTAINSFNYNNLDYVLLGLIVEEKTGESWRKNIEERILKVLKMKDTGFLAYGNYPKNFAYTYQVSKKGKFTQDPFFYIENFYAAGSMYSTAKDLLLLDQALYGENLLGEQMKIKMAESYPKFNYVGYGVWNYRYPFLDAQPTIMERRGGILGANVVLVRLTDTNQTIVILSNNSRFNPDSFGDASNLREALIRKLADAPENRE
ncbi:MAG: serine hydrolase domain-containing protein [Chitinophagales bacterium]